MEIALGWTLGTEGFLYGKNILSEIRKTLVPSFRPSIYHCALYSLTKNNINMSYNNRHLND